MKDISMTTIDQKKSVNSTNDTLEPYQKDTEVEMLYIMVQLEFCFIIFYSFVFLYCCFDSCITKLIPFFYSTIQLANLREIRVSSITILCRHRFILHIPNIVVQLLGRKVLNKIFTFSLKINILIGRWAFLPVVVMLKVVFISFVINSLPSSCFSCCMHYISVGWLCMLYPVLCVACPFRRVKIDI